MALELRRKRAGLAYSNTLAKPRAAKRVWRKLSIVQSAGSGNAYQQSSLSALRSSPAAESYRGTNLA